MKEPQTFYWSTKKIRAKTFLFALKKSNLNNLFWGECVFCSLLDVKRQEILEIASNLQIYCTCRSLQCGANFPEIPSGYGSTGMSEIRNRAG